MYPISVCIMAKDEEKNIKACIESVSSFAKEIIVLDTGSDDSTAKIAEELGAIVKKTSWNHHFGESRNKLISYATQPVILMMDTDERLQEIDRHSFEKDLQMLYERPYKAGRVEVNNQIDEGRISISFLVRLFSKTEHFRYKGSIHEQLLFKGNSPETFTTSLKLTHLGYSQDAIESKNKVVRNLKLLLEQLKVSPDDPYLLFQVGRTYYVGKQYEEAEYYLNKAYIEGHNYFSFYSSIIQSLGWTYVNLKRWSKLMALLEKAIHKFGDYTDLYYIYGSALIEMKSMEAFQLIPQAFTRCLELGEADPRKYETEAGVGSYLAHYNLGLYYELTSDLDKARYHFTESSTLGFHPANIRLEQLP